MEILLYVLLGLFGVIVLLSFWVIGVYNGLVEKRNRVKNSWAQIDVQLQRRFDLIPNLVETVKGFAKQEKDIFMAFAEARKMFASGHLTVRSLKCRKRITCSAAPSLNWAWSSNNIRNSNPIKTS